MKSVIVFGYEVFEDGTVIGKRGQKMSSWDNGRGYQILGLMVEGRRKMIAVHRLVAVGFVPNPNNLPEVNHADGDKMNNHYSNLAWCSRGENIQHAFENELRSATGVNNSKCKTDEDTVRSICQLLVAGQSSVEIRDKGFNYNLVRAVKSRKNWTHISKEYSF